jgi:hypothetical protein
MVGINLFTSSFSTIVWLKNVLPVTLKLDVIQAFLIGSLQDDKDILRVQTTRLTDTKGHPSTAKAFCLQLEFG